MLRSTAALALAALVVLALPGRVGAAGLGLGSDGAPVTVEAEEGIEWLRDGKMYVARGNARAVRGEVTIEADVLTARYRDGQNGGTDVYRLEAVGNVRIRSPREQAVADRAVYDVDQAVVVLLGDQLRLTTETDVITARDSLEYWDQRRVAVARGNAVVTREDRRIQADTLTAYFHEVGQGNLEVRQVDAIGDVVIRTASEVARGERGVYDAIRQVATLAGDVRITRGKNQLNGELAEVNLRTGVSRLLAGSAAEQGRQRVRGLFVPRRDDELPQPAAPEGRK